MIPVGYLPCTQDPPSGANMTRVIDEIIAELRLFAVAAVAEVTTFAIPKSSTLTNGRSRRPM